MIRLSKGCFLFGLFRGHEFRPDYGKLGTLSSVFPSAKIVAMTATATREYQEAITASFNMKNPSLVVANPDRANIFYEVIQRPVINCYLPLQKNLLLPLCVCLLLLFTHH